MWTAAIVAILAAPLAIRIGAAEQTGFAEEFIIITGLLATSTAAVTVILPSRLKSMTRGLGLETVMFLHRLLGVATIILLVLHIAVILGEDPTNLVLFGPNAPPRAKAGMWGVVAAVGIGVSATPWARRLRYEPWRALHLLLALILLGGAAGHIILLQHLVVLPVHGAFLGGLGGLVVAVLSYRWVLAPLSERTRFCVVSVSREAETVFTLVLRPSRPRNPLLFAPGQFAWIRTERSAFSEDHPFTIASAAQDGARVAFTIRASGDWTSTRLTRLWPGDTVWVDGPHGALTPRVNSAGIVLVAGGVGITPMVSIIRTLARRRDRRTIRLFLINRPGDDLFGDELRRAQRALDLNVYRMPPDEVSRRAAVSAAWLESGLPGSPVREELDYFLCGAPRLVEQTVVALAQLGIPETRVHTELFNVP